MAYADINIYTSNIFSVHRMTKDICIFGAKNVSNVHKTEKLISYFSRFMFDFLFNFFIIVTLRKVWLTDINHVNSSYAGCFPWMLILSLWIIWFCYLLHRTLFTFLRSDTPILMDALAWWLLLFSTGRNLHEMEKCK